MAELSNFEKSVVEGLRRELAGAEHVGDKDHARLIRAELDRLIPPAKSAREKAVRPTPETR